MSQRSVIGKSCDASGIGVYAIPCLVILVACLLRVANLGVQSIWFDEGWSWHLARLPLGEMVSVTAADRSPFLYYALLHFWIDLTGETSFAMRYLSVCADVATVGLVIALSRALFGQVKQFPVAGLLYTICPLAVWYAQETRMYALVAAFCVASCYWLWRWLRTPERLNALAISAILLMLAIYSHYYAIFLLPAHGLVVVLILALSPGAMTVRNRIHIVLSNMGRWVVATTGIICALLPWLLYASVGFAYDDGFVFPLNTIDGRFSEWISAFASGGLARALPALWPVVLIVAAVIAITILSMSRQWRILIFLSVISLVSLLSATIAVRIVYPYRSVFHPRYLIYVAPLIVMLIAGAAPAAWGAYKRVRQQFVTRLVLAAGLIPAGLVGWLWLPVLAANYANLTLARDDVHGAMVHIVEALEPGDLVVVTRDNYAVQYYLHTTFAAQADRFIAVPAGLHGVLKQDADYVAALNQFNPKRVRLFLWQDAVVDPQKLVESLLWTNGYEIGELNFGQIRMPLYQVQKRPLTRVPVTPADVSFGDGLDLAAFWMRHEGVTGDWFYAVLQWRPARKLNVNYKVFVHVLAADGHVVFQRDKQALSGLMPMSTWKVGELISDSYAMVIPADLPAGDYRVAVGVYSPDVEASRLQVKSTDLNITDDSVILGTLRIDKR